MASSLMAAQTTIYSPLCHHYHRHLPAALSRSSTLRRATPNPLPFQLRIKSSATRNHSLSTTSSSTLQNQPLKSSRSPPPNVLHGPTRAATTLLATALALSKLIAGEALTLTLPLRQPIIQSIGPAFFAAIKDAPTGSLNTPLTVVAAGMAKWLDLYSTVLTVRILLSWFPNIPWERQPLSAIRDLCDPYLNLFRNIIPPIFDSLDVSPLLAFAVLGTLGSILNSSRQCY